MELNPLYDNCGRLEVDTYNAFVRHEIHGEWVRFKNGNPRYFTYYPVTWLRSCDCCNKISTPKRIQYRYLLGFDYLCMSCFGKMTPLIQAQRAITEAKKALTLLNRTLNENVRKTENES